MKVRTIVAAVVSTALLCGGMYLLVKNDVAQKIAWNRIKDYAPSPIVRNILDDAVQVDGEETTVNDSIPEIPQEMESEMIDQVQQLEENYRGSIGWIYVPDTHINYPVMQSGDNAFYLHRAADGSDLYAGSIFLDYQNADFSSISNILYGHHMENDSMFADVTKFTDEVYFSGRPYGWLTTKHEVYCVQFFAVDLVESTDGIYNTEADQSSVMREIVNHAVIYNDIELADTDRLLMLSTCTSANSTSRTVLVGKMIGGDMYE